MTRILFIAPYPDMKSMVENAFQSYDQRGDVSFHTLIATTEDVARNGIPPCDGVIARGYTARTLKAALSDIPIIELDFEACDLIRALQECHRQFAEPVVALVGFQRTFEEMSRFADLFGCAIRAYVPASYQAIDAVVAQAVRDGCGVIIGGYAVHLRALAHGVRSVVVRTGEEAVHRALDEAVRAAEIMHRERVKAQMYQTITMSSSDGILYVDHEGVIRVDNPAAGALCRGVLKERRLADLFPDLDEVFCRSMASGKGISDGLLPIGQAMVSFDCTPVMIEERPAGAVIRLQNITRVQQLERRIRKTLSVRGLTAKYRFDDIAHRSSLIADVIEHARRYAQVTSNILILGETGTGKELFAQSIHNASPRHDGPFVAVNCAALPESLLESELFGHVEGAFTGTAKGGKLGLFEMAHNGTLFLDEISEIPLRIQSTLLRVLQEREVRRIGDDKVIPVNVRIISASNRSLRKLAECGQFRLDLLYRLDVLTLFVPPLRRRPEDVPALCEVFLREYSEANHDHLPSLEADALVGLMGHAFRGNARELRNLVERACVLRDAPTVLCQTDVARVLLREDPDEIPLPDSLNQPTPATDTYDKGKNLTDERARLLKALEDCGGNRSATARHLGMARSTLWRKLLACGID